LNEKIGVREHRRGSSFLNQKKKKVNLAGPILKRVGKWQVDGRKKKQRKKYKENPGAGV